MNENSIPEKNRTEFELPDRTGAAPSLFATASIEAVAVPAIIEWAGESTSKRFLEFFAARIRNRNTRAAYHHAACQFLNWCDDAGIALPQIEPLHVATYIEEMTAVRGPSTVKQHLAGIKMLFDWLLVGHFVATNPAAAVRGPAYSVTKGKTPVLDESEAKRLLASIESDTPVGQRDRAIIATMIYTFGRISAVTLMDVGDYYPNGKRWWVRLKEKGGKHHEMPAHHKLEEYLDAYLGVWGQARDSRHPLFITAPRWNREFTLLRLSRTDAWAMVKRRARAAGIATPVSYNRLLCSVR